MAAVSMSKQEFVRLEVLLGVQSGRLRVADVCALIGLRRRQVFRLLRGIKQNGAASLLSMRRGRPSKPSAAGGGSYAGFVARARSVSRLWPDPGGGEAGDAARLLDLAGDVARLDDRGRAVDRSAAPPTLLASATPAA